jgi:hypothetical protein
MTATLAASTIPRMAKTVTALKVVPEPPTTLVLNKQKKI